MAFILYSVSQKSSPTKTFCDIFTLGESVIEKLLPFIRYCLTMFLLVYQLWYIHLNICVNCVTFTSNAPHILTTRYTLLLN